MMPEPHETVEPLLSAYLDGELDAERRRLVDTHLATCQICRETLAGLRVGDDALAALAPTPAAPALRREFRRRLRRQGARSGLTAGLAVIFALTAWSLLRDLKKLARQTDMPLWFRLTRALSALLLLTSLSSLFRELLRDVRALAEYAWLSGEKEGEDQ
ncbi:MAG TPA: zf-HC2 domain-containing protein [Chloroflexota bacterium]|nr:zf-HC2 domain-containing protein [Chloroflexota bacterium]